MTTIRKIGRVLSEMSFEEWTLLLFVLPLVGAVLTLTYVGGPGR